MDFNSCSTGQAPSLSASAALAEVLRENSVLLLKSVCNRMGLPAPDVTIEQQLHAPERASLLFYATVRLALVNGRTLQVSADATMKKAAVAKACFELLQMLAKSQTDGTQSELLGLDLPSSPLVTAPQPRPRQNGTGAGGINVVASPRRQLAATAPPCPQMAVSSDAATLPMSATVPRKPVPAPPAPSFTLVEKNARRLAFIEWSRMATDTVGATSEPPAQTWASTVSFMHQAFLWSAAFTNELRRLKRERGAQGAVQALASRRKPSVRAAARATVHGTEGDKSETLPPPAAALPELGVAVPSLPPPPPLRLVDAARLRVAEECDFPAILGMVRELAEFERDPDAVLVTEAMLRRDGTGAAPLFHVFLAELPCSTAAAAASAVAAGHEAGGTIATASAIAEAAAAAPADMPTRASPAFVPVAMAFCHAGYSTWEGRVLFLDDLYVQPAYRRQGFSGLFFEALARAALVGKFARVQWTALEWNAPAVDLYRGPAVGATYLEGWQLYRLLASKGDIVRVAAVKTVCPK